MIGSSLCIDTHSHWMPPVHLAAVRRLVTADPVAARDYKGMLAVAEDPEAPLVALERRLAEMDASGVDVSVHVVPRPDDEPFGAGELVHGPVSGAIANAVFAATGLRARNLPITAARLRDLAASDD